jgi:hypothetical protein
MQESGTRSWVFLILLPMILEVAVMYYLLQVGIVDVGPDSMMSLIPVIPKEDHLVLL